MSRFNPHHQTHAVYEATQSWVDRCLLQDGSILSQGSLIWSAENLDELDRHFVQNLDEGEGDFLGKLEIQLTNASTESVKLMAELNWVLLLFASRITPATKRNTVRTIWNWSGDVLDANHELLSDELLEGIGHAGVAFNTLRWKEVVALIEIFRRWKALAEEGQRERISDPWKFQTWLAEQANIQSRAIFQILPHLLFPDTFERISSRGDKVSILVAFTDEPKRVWNRKSQREIDEALLSLRSRLEEQEGEAIDFYWPNMKQVWRPKAENVDPSEQAGGTSEFAAALEQFLDAYGAARNGPYSTVGVLSRAMADLRTWIEQCPPVASRDTLRVKISVGQGNWTRTPWIALLDERVTTSTQRGFYVVFLVSDDLSVTYLTLNQGMTELVAGLGQRGATQAMESFAVGAREEIAETLAANFELSNAIDLQASTSASANYQAGTLAYKSYSTGSMPTDDEISEDLELLLTAYDELIEVNGKAATPQAAKTNEPYSVDNALQDLFLERDELEDLLEIWEGKTNLILQGAPGVGKSYVSRRLAYCLLGEAAPERVRSVQFHQSYSYEDFVRGFRPSAEGGFTLQDGIFLEFCAQATADPGQRYVLLIDEINRGNLSKILGELMLLVEADKREASQAQNKEWTVQLAYSHPEEEEFWVPDNLFILGMMNTADRSLSLVDYALRRRFAFAEIAPKFTSELFQTTLSNKGIPGVHISKIVDRMEQLNTEIEGDKTNLGSGFCIGHSFFVPRESVSDSRAWYRRIVRTEIVPLLKEYWFDDPERVEQWRAKLLAE